MFVAWCARCTPLREPWSFPKSSSCENHKEITSCNTSIVVSICPGLYTTPHHENIYTAKKGIRVTCSSTQTFPTLLLLFHNWTQVEQYTSVAPPHLRWPMAFLPFTSMITSPRRIPARSAGPNARTLMVTPCSNFRPIDLSLPVYLHSNMPAWWIWRAYFSRWSVYLVRANIESGMLKRERCYVFGSALHTRVYGQ